MKHLNKIELDLNKNNDLKKIIKDKFINLYSDNFFKKMYGKYKIESKLYNESKIYGNQDPYFLLWFFQEELIIFEKWVSIEKFVGITRFPLFFCT